MRESGHTLTAGPAHDRIRSVLVVAQTALGVVLLIGAGLLIRSFESLTHVDLGFNPSHLLTAHFDLSETRYGSDQMDRFISEFFRRVRALPGVTSVGGAMPLPMGGNDGLSVGFNLLDHPVSEGNWHAAGFYVVTNGFFESMRIPLLHGRTFDERDQRNSAPVMIITETFAKDFFPNEDPIGRKIEIGADDGAGRERYKTREVIGVVGDIRNSNVSKPPVAAYYVPYSQLVWGAPALIVRAGVDPETLVPAIAKVLASMDPETPLFDVRSMEDNFALDLGRARFQAVLVGIFAGIALLLTAIGLYGVIAYSVGQRTHEIGMRMALGAHESDVLRLIVKRGVVLVVVGLCIGVAAALGLTRYVESMLYGVKPIDPLTFGGVSISLFAVALVASYIPARRAMRVDPMVALRYE